MEAAKVKLVTMTSSPGLILNVLIPAQEQLYLKSTVHLHQDIFQIFSKIFTKDH